MTPCRRPPRRSTARRRASSTTSSCWPPGRWRRPLAFDEPGSPVTLTLPPEVAAAAEAAGAVELVDPEGLPLARVSVPGGAVVAADATRSTARSAGSTSPRRRPASGTPGARSSRSSTRSPRPRSPCSRRAGPVLLLALVGHGTPELPATGLIRATLAAADLLPDAAVVAVPLASHGDADADHALGLQVVANYAGPDPVIGVPDSASPSPARDPGHRRPGAPGARRRRASSSSSPGCPAAASRRWPAR